MKMVLNFLALILILITFRIFAEEPIQPQVDILSINFTGSRQTNAEDFSQVQIFFSSSFTVEYNGLSSLLKYSYELWEQGERSLFTRKEISMARDYIGMITIQVEDERGNASTQPRLQIKVSIEDSSGSSSEIHYVPKYLQGKDYCQKRVIRPLQLKKDEETAVWALLADTQMISVDNQATIEDLIKAHPWVLVLKLSFGDQQPE